MGAGPRGRGGPAWRPRCRSPGCTLALRMTLTRFEAGADGRRRRIARVCAHVHMFARAQGANACRPGDAWQYILMYTVRGVGWGRTLRHILRSPSLKLMEANDSITVAGLGRKGRGGGFGWEGCPCDGGRPRIGRQPGKGRAGRCGAHQSELPVMPLPANLGARAKSRQSTVGPKEGSACRARLAVHLAQSARQAHAWGVPVPSWPPDPRRGLRGDAQRHHGHAKF